MEEQTLTCVHAHTEREREKEILTQSKQNIFYNMNFYQFDTNPITGMGSSHEPWGLQFGDEDSV